MADLYSKLLDWDTKHEAEVHQLLCWFLIAFGFFTLLVTLGVFTPPYGRHEAKSSSWGPKIPPTLAWMLMESPSMFIPLLCLWPDPATCLAAPSNKILLGLFIFHYVNRAIIFPLRMRGGKPMPLTVCASAFFFCTFNGYLQGRHLTTLSCVKTEGSLAADPRFAQPHFYAGLILFLIGWTANYHSDSILRNLRKPGETGYKIPCGGLFELVSGANFASETLEWIGFAIAANTFPAWVFAFFTSCNVGPRALAHHRWYQTQFKEEYPAKRKAYIPFLL